MAAERFGRYVVNQPDGSRTIRTSLANLHTDSDERLSVTKIKSTTERIGGRRMTHEVWTALTR